MYASERFACAGIYFLNAAFFWCDFDAFMKSFRERNLLFLSVLV